MTLAERIEAGFTAHFGGKPAILGRAPGRVNLIGEHTDYNDGFAMPVAIGQETRVAFRPGADRSVRVAALDFGETDTFDAHLPTYAEAGGWRNYVRGVVDMLARAGVDVPGGELAIAGDIAKGTGLSSSASLEVCVAGVLLKAAGLDWDPVRIALLAQSAECDFVGMRCGNLDQIASACTVAGHALLIDCRSLETRSIPIPRDVRIMIVQSGVVRGLVDGEYNRRRAECESACAALGVPALRDVDEAGLEAGRASMDPVVFRRARHVVRDNRRTLEAADALAANDLVSAGVLLRDSHQSQAEDFEITVPDTDRLAFVMNAAIGSEGGARQTGGGFGGAVVGFMREDRVEAVRHAVMEGYRTPDGAAPDISIEQPSAGAAVWKVDA